MPVPLAPPLRWGIVGPGAIAEVFAHALQRAAAGRITKVFGRSAERAAAFANRHVAAGPDTGGHGAVATDLAALCRDIDALYVATPHSEHAVTVRHGLEAGIAVLCEKPMTTNAALTRELVALADARNGLLLEAYMYRTHPQIARTVQLVHEGAIGRLQTIRSAFGFTAEGGAGHRLFAKALGGGAILDIGGYPVSLALLLARASGHPGLPELVAVDGKQAATGVDAFARATLRWDGLEAHVQCAIDRDIARTTVLQGEHGSLTITDPFLPEGRRDGRIGELLVTSDGSEHREHVAAPHDCFGAEALAMAALVAQRRAGAPAIVPPPMVTPAESVQIAELCEAWRHATAAATR